MKDFFLCLICVIIIPARFLFWPLAAAWAGYGGILEMTGKVKIKYDLLNVTHIPEAEWNPLVQPSKKKK